MQDVGGDGGLESSIIPIFRPAFFVLYIYNCIFKVSSAMCIDRTDARRYQYLLRPYSSHLHLHLSY